MDLETELKTLQKQYSDLKSEKIKRPATKQEYLALLVSIEEQIKETKEQIDEKKREDAAKIPYVAPVIISDAEKWVAIRAKRNADLSGNDWTQLPDVPLTKSQRDAWKAYRQALRDIPQDYRDPDAVKFPEKPE